MERYISKIIQIIDSLELKSRESNGLLAQSENTDEFNFPTQSWLNDFYEEDSVQNPETTEHSEQTLPIDTVEEESAESESLDSEEVANPEDEAENPHEEFQVIIDSYFQQNNEAVNDIYKLLNKSVLAGEYIYNDQLVTDLKDVEARLAVFSNNSIVLPFELQENVSEFISTVKLGCLSYSFFIKNIENEYSLDKIDYMFSWNQKVRKDFNRAQLDDDSEKLWRYFVNNLDLSIYDHFFSSENVQLQQLYYIENSVDDFEILGFESINKTIKLKLNFLKHKWKARKQQENPQSIHFSIDGNMQVVEEYSPENKKLLDWVKLINSHYELYISNWKYETELRVKTFRKNPLNSLTYLQLHQLIKYYKDVKQDYYQLTEIAKFLKRKDSSSERLFYDKYAVEVVANYANNNQFSLFLENSTDVKEIKHHFLSAKENKKGEMNNFFLDYKYLNAIVSVLHQKLDEEDNLTFLKNYEKLIIDECSKMIEQYYNSKEWSKTNNNYIFMLPFQECQVEIPELDIDDLPSIFIASSFILPAVNNHIERQYEDVKQKFRSLLFQINSIKRIKKDLEQIQDLKQELDKRDFKSIEIISIFTAIITFVLSSIPAYKFVDNVSEAILFMITLACALGLFVLLILLATKGFFKQWATYLYLALLSIVLVIGYNIIIKDEKIDSKTTTNMMRK
jgi:hypothetical protein